MTIGIGVLCATYDDFDDRPSSMRPDALILAADTMGSCETDSTPQMHKIFVHQGLPLLACGAGRLDMCGELFSTFSDGLSAHANPRTHGNIWKILVQSVIGYRHEKFEYDTLIPQFGWRSGLIPSESERVKILEAWQAYPLGFEMLVGTFDYAGQALLYYVGRKEQISGLVHLVSVPGHEAIGTGAYNASLWLNYREQHLGCSIDRSVLHALEAARFASSAPTVNDEVEIAICTKSCLIMRSSHSDSPEHTEFPIKHLMSQVEKYGPRSTKEIAFRQLDAQTLKDQQ